ncbi:MAG: ATP-binding protein [Patescibacteria group bacterium]
MTLYIMCGVGFSGKSTLAKSIAAHFAIPLVSLDSLYFEHEKELEDTHYDDAKQWKILLEMSKEKIRGLLIEKTSVVFDNVNLIRKHRDELRELARQTGANAVVVYLDTPEDLLTERQTKNKETEERHDVEQHYLDEAKKQLEIPSAEEAVYAFTPGTDVEKFLQQLPR